MSTKIIFISDHTIFRLPNLQPPSEEGVFTASKQASISLIEMKKLDILDRELSKNKLPLTVSLCALLLSILTSYITDYWPVAVFTTLPLVLRYSEHEITLLTARRRVKNGGQK